MSNLNESIRDWMQANIEAGDPLDGVDIMTMGETGDRTPPFVSIYESAADLYEQDGVTMYGVTAFELTVELQTVPASADEDGTALATEQAQRDQIYALVGNRDAIPYVNGRNGWQVFDIRTGSAITSAEDDRRISRWIITVIASVL